MTPVVGTIKTFPYSEAELRDDVRATHEAHAATVHAFQRAFYQARHTWSTTRFRGVPIMKPPTDIWTYHELMEVLQPTVVIETGTAFGGSALLFASQPSVRRVFTIDVEGRPDRPKDVPITYVQGSSTDPLALAFVRRQLEPDDRVMVVLDSNHHRDHVLCELALYAPLVTPGQLLVVEDTNLEAVGQSTEGPEKALEHWLPQHPEFVREPIGDRYLLTFNTWLRKR